jgi:O-antigen/teichoic acid export membrane protein
LYAILVLKDSPEQSLVIILGLNLLLNSFLVLEHYYIAIVQGKKNAISKIVAISISSGIKITLIHFEAELIYFVITLVVETTFYSALLVTLYLSKRPTLVKPDVSQMKSFIKNGWPFILSDYSMFLLKKVDILMVKYFLGFAAVGYYSVAVKISVLLAILPMVVLTSIFPYLVKSDSEAALEKSMVKLYRLFVIGMVLVCIGVAALSEDIVYFLFGTEFSESATLLTIYAWSGLFMTIHMINNKWFIIKNLQKEFFYRALISGLVNVVLSYIAIQEFGLPGAASGTLISMVILSYVSLYFSANGRKLLHIFHSSFFVRNKNVQNIL